VKKLVEIAEKESADALAHGCTGKGNDQVRFDVGTAALASNIKTLAPVRNSGMTREEEIDYAKKHGIPVPVKKGAAYSIDENLWGRSIECGVLEDPWNEPPEDAYRLTASPVKGPDNPEYITIEWEEGHPVSLNGETMSLASLIETLNDLGGKHGVGRIDHIENRVVGIKSREVYECPAAAILIDAHKAVEDLALPKEIAQFKSMVDMKWSETVYAGLWFSPLKDALDAFVDESQKRVTGTTKMKLFKGKASVVGRKSPYSMYDLSLATYEKGDLFDHSAAEGFINLFGLSTRVWTGVGRNTK